MLRSLCRLQVRNVHGAMFVRAPATSFVRTFATHDPDEVTTWDRMKNSMSDKLTSRQEGKQADMFHTMLDHMASIQKYDIKAFLEFNKTTLENSGAEGWKSKLPWGQNAETKQQADELRRTIQALEAIPDEMKHKKKIPVSMARDVAERVGMDYEDMRVIRYKLQMSQQMHKWLRHRVKAELPLPKTQDDMSFLMRETPLKMNKKEMYNAQWDSMKRRYQ